MTASPTQIAALTTVVADRRSRLTDVRHPEAARRVLAECEAALAVWTGGAA